MLFDRVVSALLYGAFALFSSESNGHVATCTNVTKNGKPVAILDSDYNVHVGDTIVRQYSCKSSRSHKFLYLLNLNTWIHEQSVEVKDKQAVVSDKLTWPSCSARRIYTLFKCKDDNIERRNDQWRLDCKNAPLMLQSVRRKMIRELASTDTRVFAAFVKKCRDDKDNVEHDDDGDEESIMSIILRQFPIE